MNDIFILPLTNTDNICIIDAEDLVKVMKYRWYMESGGYIKSTNTPYVWLADTIMETAEYRIDHKNRLRFDNRKINLRFTSKAFNNANRTKRSDKCTSKYKGVSWDNFHKKWRVRIQIQNKDIHLGYFLSENEAALKYNSAAIIHHKEFAYLNTIL